MTNPIVMKTTPGRLAKKRASLKRAAQRGILTTLGIELRRRRREHEITQQALGADAGVSANVVGGIERGVYNPSIVVLYAITTRLGIELSDLFSGAERLSP